MKKCLFLLVCLFHSLAVWAATTTIFHTSDTHGFFFPRNGQGGAAALAAVLQKESTPYLLLDSGDFANGTVETRTSKGMKAALVMNQLQYTATTIGNHEFDFKAPQFAKIISALNFPVLAANFKEENSEQYPPHILPYLVLTRNGVKFAIIGLANDTPTHPATGFRFTDPLEALEQALEEVEPEQPDVVIVLVHDGLTDAGHGTREYVAQIAHRFDGRVHIVLGGHAHEIVQNHYIGNVLFVESGSEFNMVSKITVVTDDETGKFQEAYSAPIVLTLAQTGEDPATKAFMETVREPGVDIVLGHTWQVFHYEPTTAAHLDAQLPNWEADLMRAYAGVEAALCNVGSFRQELPQGEITRRHLIDAQPYDNFVTVVSVSGKFLRQFIVQGLSPYSLFAYSGLQIKFNPENPAATEITLNAVPLQDEQIYQIAVNSYIAEGNAEGALFKQIPASFKKTIGTKTVLNLMEEALLSGQVQVPPATGRILLVPAGN